MERGLSLRGTGGLWWIGSTHREEKAKGRKTAGVSEGSGLPPLLLPGSLEGCPSGEVFLYGHT